MALTGGGTTQLRGLLRKMHDIRGGALAKLLIRDLQEELLDLTAERFRSGTDPDGNRWAPLRLRSGRPLRDRGTLANSFAILRANRRQIVIGSPMETAEFHQHGTGLYGPRGKRIVPKHSGKFVTVTRRSKSGKVSRFKRWQAPALAWTTRGAKGTNKKGARGSSGFVVSSVAGSPKRKMLPGKNIPQAYMQAFDETARERLRLWFR